jgi:hypothetical protein
MFVRQVLYHLIYAPNAFFLLSLLSDSISFFPPRPALDYDHPMYASQLLGLQAYNAILGLLVEMGFC